MLRRAVSENIIYTYFRRKGAHTNLKPLFVQKGWDTTISSSVTLETIANRLWQSIPEGYKASSTKPGFLCVSWVDKKRWPHWKIIGITVVVINPGFLLLPLCVLTRKSVLHVIWLFVCPKSSWALPTPIIDIIRNRWYSSMKTVKKQKQKKPVCNK